MSRFLLLALACVALPGVAVELELDRVTASTASGDVRLRLTSRAVFDFDPGAGVLTSSGSFVAEYQLPNQLTRFGHKVEDLRVTVEGDMAMKSYECVEGAFGAAFLAANLCGNYRFGPNGLDDGGIADDAVQGPPRSLAGHRAGDFDWDGTELEFTLLPDPAAGAQIFNETGLRLHFTVRPGR